jgi:hypothetical protein
VISVRRHPAAAIPLAPDNSKKRTARTPGSTIVRDQARFWRRIPHDNLAALITARSSGAAEDRGDFVPAFGVKLPTIILPD